MKKFVIPFLLLFTSCSQSVRMQATGYTQGTTYSVIYFNDGDDFQYQIDSLLLQFDRVLSTYQQSSYISEWNRNETAGVEEPAWFKDVLKCAKEVHISTEGAFDITVSPMMKFWFDRDWSNAKVDSSQVDSIMQFVGMEQVEAVEGAFIKRNPSVQLDVDGLAQGYAVDVLSLFLESKGVTDYLVEIGGEVRANGTKPKDEPWKVGIDSPTENNFDRELVLSVELNNEAMATSGNYRKFVEIDGQKFGHTLNARNGYPAKTDVLSATVFAKDCMRADAYATAFMVMGFDGARRIVESNPDLDAVLIHSVPEGVNIWKSDGVREVNLN